MNAKALIRELIGRSDTLSQNKLAVKLGLSPQTMSSRMQASDIKVGFMCEMLDAMDYQLVVMPKYGGRLPNGSIVVGREGE